MRKRSFGLVSGIFGMLLLLAATSGCSYSMYEDSENWAIIDNDTPTFYASYDLIFLYPSQEETCEGGYMNWVYGNVGEELRRYVRLVISAQFGPRVRVFSPFVPILSFRDYGEIMEEFKKNKDHRFDFRKTKLKVPIDYMVDALDVYFSEYNSDGHPVVIYGQGQGALILYEAMKRCGKVSPKNGFVAGYFFGLPGVTGEEIVSDFGSRGIKPAGKRNEVSVIVVCNTRAGNVPLEKTLAMPGGAVINPLNWRTDATPAGKKTNPEALFFDHKETNPTHKVKRVTNFCGAKVDPKNGIVNLIELPANCKYKMNEFQFGSDVWGVFPGSVSRNAKDRVNMYRFLRKGVEMPE